MGRNLHGDFKGEGKQQHQALTGQQGLEHPRRHRVLAKEPRHCTVLQGVSCLAERTRSVGRKSLLESGILRIITRIFISFLDLEIRLTQYNTKWLHSYQLMCYELYSENAVHR